MSTDLYRFAPITVAIPAIPPRAHTLLPRAVQSVRNQTLVPQGGVEVALDADHEGAVITRGRALAAVKTEWVAFLDDDDEFMPQHLDHLFAHAQNTGADYVFSWFQIIGPDCKPIDFDPLGRFGQEWNPDDPHQTTSIVLVRTELAQQVGFKEPLPGRTIHGQRWGEDFTFTLDCRDAGAKIVHLPERTWWWHHHGANTSGRPDKW